jgi:type II secretory ATPase GspE/PulE/Tfp pilus assembly ATPase PilB-like protein
VVVTALPNEGFSTLWRAILGGCDRFLRDHYVLDPAGQGEKEVINFHSVTYDTSAGQTPQSLLPELLLREPHVLAFSDLTDGAQLNEICRLAKSVPLLTLTRLYSRHAIEALPRLLALKPDAKSLAENLTAVVSMRLVRKLCEYCKQPYQPAPQVLAKLGIPPNRVQKFFRPLPFQPGKLDEEGNEIPPCDVCQGLGYVGRTGVCELLQLTPALREALQTNPRVDHLTRVAEEGGHISMRDEAVVLVAKGITSLEELQRVFSK